MLTLSEITTPGSFDDLDLLEEAHLQLIAIEAGGARLNDRIRHDALDDNIAFATVIHSWDEVSIDNGDGTRALPQSDGGALYRMHVITLVWRPERVSWLVHSFGDFVHPDALPRTSPDEAPG